MVEKEPSQAQPNEAPPSETSPGKTSPSETQPPDFVELLAKWRAVRAPGEGHGVLASMVGHWDATVRFHGGEEIWESAATATKTLVHGGRFLVEELSGEIHAPDEQGHMRPEPYTATRTLGYDMYKKVYAGTFVENQNTHLLTFVGPANPFAAREIELFGLSDEPMLDLRDGTLKHVLRLEGPDRHAWEVNAMAAGGKKVFDFIYARRADPAQR